MKPLLSSTLVFVGFFLIGWATAPAPAECRACNSKTCFFDSDCGRLCSCVFPGGKTNKRGVCMQVGQ